MLICNSLVTSNSKEEGYKRHTYRINLFLTRALTPGSIVIIKRFACSTGLSMKFHSFIKTTMLKNKDFIALKLSDVAFILLINVNANKF